MKTKVVFDTNIYISTVAAPNAHSKQWLEAARNPNRTFDVYISEPIIQETAEKLIGKLGLTPELVEEVIEEIRETAILVEPTERIAAIKRDPDDNKILECAIAADAKFVISSDKDLLQLRGFRDIVVYHPNNLKYLFPLDFRRAA